MHEGAVSMSEFNEGNFEERADRVIEDALQHFDRGLTIGVYSLEKSLYDCAKTCPQKLPDLIDKMQAPMERLFQKGEAQTAAQILRAANYASRDAGAFGAASLEKTMDLFEKYEPCLSKEMGKRGSTHDIASDFAYTAYKVSDSTNPGTFVRAKKLADLSPHRADPLTPVSEAQSTRVENHARNIIAQKPPGA